MIPRTYQPKGSPHPPAKVPQLISGVGSPPLVERIKAALMPHTGREHAITAPDLARRLRAPERSIRETIAESADFQPCSVPGEGFFWPEDAEEIFDSEERLAKQEAALGERRKRFRAFWEKQGITFPKIK